MSRHLLASLVLVAACAAAACTPQAATPPLPGASASASAAPSAAASAAPSAQPSAVPSASASASDAPSAAPSASPSASAAPSAAPSASAAPAGSLDMSQGKLLRRYDFKGISGIYYDFSRDQLAVIDGIDEDETPRRYVVRRFKRDGTFEVAVDLHKAGEKAPDAVDGVAFDLAGTLFYTYREDEAWKLRQLFTATVVDTTRMPTREVERAGLSTLAADDNVITLGVMRYDPEATETTTVPTVRDVLYARAEENETPEAIFRIPDPFEPTSHMAIAPGGILYLMGPKKGGGFGIKRVGPDQKLEDAPIALSQLPDHLWIGPDGDVWLADDTTGNAPAVMRRYGADGTLKGETPITLKDGAKVYDLDGLTFDARKEPILAGKAISADLQTYTGLFTFE